MKPKEIVLYIHKLLSMHQINFILECGSLLFAYRDNGKFREDDDFDLSIHRGHFDRLKDLIFNDSVLKPFLVVKKEWKNELSIKINGYQVDFNVYDYDAKNVYSYWYTKNPNDNNNWTLGYRIKFPRQTYLPLRDIQFLGVTWKCCADIEAKLALHYGADWRIPKNEFYNIHNTPCVDHSYLSDEKEGIVADEKVAIVLSTFMRDDIIVNTLEHYSKMPYKIYLLDQGIWNKEKEQVYAKYRALGHDITYAPFDAGLSYTRNRLLEKVQEEYVFLTDDDIRARDKFDSLVTILEKDKSLGIVGGQLYNVPFRNTQVYSYNLNLENDELIYTKVHSGKCDIVLNYFVARTAVFKDIKYDENLKLCEHTDFFLRMKFNTKWKTFYEPNFIGDHFPLRTKEYEKLRQREEFTLKFKEKWGIRNTSYR